MKLNHLNACLVGILRTKKGTPVLNAVKALEVAFTEGLHAVEITANSDGWQEILSECVKLGLNIGAGSIKNKSLAQEAIQNGAKFLVSPGLFEEVVSVAHENKIPMIPGIYSLYEAKKAVKLGAVDLKFFPANIKTTEDLLKAIKEPFRDEFDELVNKGWEIFTFDSPEFTRLELTNNDFITIDSPTEFYEQYLTLINQKPICPVVIRLPSGNLGFERLKEIADYLKPQDISVFAVGGISEKNLKEVLLNYNASGVCVGSGVFNGDAILNGDFERVKNDAKRHVDLIKEIFAVK